MNLLYWSYTKKKTARIIPIVDTDPEYSKSTNDTTYTDSIRPFSGPVIVEHPPKKLNDKIYYKLTQNIRNLVPFTSDEIEYIKTLHKDNLVEIIYIYNSHITNIHDILV